MSDLSCLKCAPLCMTPWTASRRRPAVLAEVQVNGRSDDSRGDAGCPTGGTLAKSGLELANRGVAGLLRPLLAFLSAEVTEIGDVLART